MNVAVWIWSAQMSASVGSVAVGRPWTALVSGRRYPPQVRAHPLFAAANRRITAVWAAYFAVAAIVSAFTAPWTSLLFAAPTPALAWLSYRAGNGYAAARLAQPIPTKEGAMTDDRQDALRALVEGKSDEEILAAALAEAGTFDAVLDQTMDGMREALDPDAAEDCVIGYEIETPDATYGYRVEVRGRDVIIEQRSPDDARVVLGLALPDYLRLINGLLDGTQAFMSGRMKLRGDVMFAPQIARIFRTA
jgi:putative sterol carrier protein